MQDAIAFARAAGYRRMTLWTNDILNAARAIYIAEGFRLVAEEKHHSFGKDLVGQNWERCGNVRFAVVYKPQGEEPDGALARERAELLAQEWSGAMQETRGGSVRDFVSVGDVSIRAIGADNVMPDCEVPVRQILEQLVAKTGLPPFLLGLSWSSTERMSSQQADMLTSEITALRRTLTPMVERVCRLWLRLHGYGCRFAVEWDDINLQDLVEEAKAELYREQARRLRLENDEREEQT